MKHTSAQAIYLLPQVLDLIRDPIAVVNGIETCCIDNLASPGESNDRSLTFIARGHPEGKAMLSQTMAAIVLCHNDLSNENAKRSNCIVKVSDPKLTFARIGNALFPENTKPGIHPTAQVDPEARIASTCTIGPFCVIGKAVLEAGTSVGSSVVIHDRTEIGRNVRIFHGCTIGREGFGYVRNETGAYINFPHVGKVVIGDDVDIGAGTCIDRGALGRTVIDRGTKIDNQVHIGHNVVIEEDVLIAAHVSIGGSSRVGRGASLWLGAKLADGSLVGAGACVGIGSVVIEPIPSQKKCFGNPARVVGSVDNVR